MVVRTPPGSEPTPVPLVAHVRMSCVVVAAMVLVNPSDMAAAVMYAAKKLDDADDDVDIFIVNDAGDKLSDSVTIDTLKEADITVAKATALTVAKATNSLLEKKRLAEELEAAKAEIEALKRARLTDSSAATK